MTRDTWTFNNEEKPLSLWKDSFDEEVIGFISFEELRAEVERFTAEEVKSLRQAGRPLPTVAVLAQEVVRLTDLSCLRDLDDLSSRLVGIHAPLCLSILPRPGKSK